VRLGIRSDWIQETELDFEALVSTYKQVLYKPNEIVEQSVDVGASFTLKGVNYAVTVNFGPMELPQLETMLIFKPPKLPKVATFLDVDYYLVMEQTEVTEKALREFVTAGLNYADEQSRRLMIVLPKEAR